VSIRVKVRYKGLAKNAAQVFALIGLSNLYLASRAMTGTLWAKCARRAQKRADGVTKTQEISGKRVKIGHPGRSRTTDLALIAQNINCS